MDGASSVDQSLWVHYELWLQCDVQYFDLREHSKLHLFVGQTLYTVSASLSRWRLDGASADGQVV